MSLQNTIDFILDINTLVGFLIGSAALKFIQHKNDVKLRNAKYLDYGMESLYLPIYKIIFLNEKENKYRGIDKEEFQKIENLVEQNLALADKNLIKIINIASKDLDDGLYVSDEEEVIEWLPNHENGSLEETINYYDVVREDEKRRDFQMQSLYHYIHFAFNKYRKSLDLPYSKLAINKWRFWYNWKTALYMFSNRNKSFNFNSKDDQIEQRKRK